MLPLIQVLFGENSFVKDRLIVFMISSHCVKDLYLTGDLFNILFSPCHCRSLGRDSLRDMIIKHLFPHLVKTEN